MDCEAQIRLWLMQDEMRLKVIKIVSSLNIPDCWVAAGFIRNLVWDRLHNYAHPTALNDIDVIYYNSENIDESEDLLYESQLKLSTSKTLDFSVKNQARMHYKLKRKQYKNIHEAMSYWPEIETAVGVRWIDGRIQFIAPFGLECLFNKTVTYNARSSFQAFTQRINSKRWLEMWPELIVKNNG
ncbi:nucleotidyltransferase family protein [Brenneria izadpanahii]|uniref:Nucleotidyltransferase family protein n=1 Tax=Brenneria izadpanahii TaxID=2722756 RepID=A0ABX7UQ22_9GAMM|nr:nucleotidyltransferase family protein [Brenneria izadpanahii]QTF07689.1 nucleotidyltransferase family protein [Brenneria izadpanahii]